MGKEADEAKWRSYYEAGLEHYEINHVPTIDDFTDFKAVQFKSAER